MVGETKGRGKLDVHHEHKLPVKTVWLYPLRRDFTRWLKGKAVRKRWKALLKRLDARTLKDNDYALRAKDHGGVRRGSGSSARKDR